LAISCCGCQTLKPFSGGMRDKVSAARQWTENGFSAVRRGAAREAKSYFARASNELPDDPLIAANLARAHYQAGELDQAIDAMSRAVDLSGRSSELVVELGEYMLASGRIDDAKSIVAYCLQQEHRSASVWSLNGRTKGATGDYAGALRDYQRALGFDENREDIQLQIVDTYQRLNQPLRALSSVEQILQQYPDDRQPERALIAKGDALVQLNQLEPAIELFQVASSREGISGMVWVKLADAQVRAGRLEQAKTTLAHAREKYPSDARVADFVTRIGEEDRVALLHP